MSDPKSVIKTPSVTATEEASQGRVEQIAAPTKKPAAKKNSGKTSASRETAAANATKMPPAKSGVAKVKTTPVTPAKPGKEHKAKKAAVPKKPKLIRDSFTFPENEYVLIRILKEKALKAGLDVKKSELLRAGLAVLASMPAAQLLKAMERVERIKTGRPTK